MCNHPVEKLTACISKYVHIAIQQLLAFLQGIYSYVATVNCLPSGQLRMKAARKPSIIFIIVYLYYLFIYTCSSIYIIYTV